MKALTLRDLDIEDSLRLSFNGAFDQHGMLERELTPIFQALEENAGDWMPDVVEGKRQYKYSRDVIWKSLDEKRRDKSTSIALHRSSFPAVSLTLYVGLATRRPRLSVSLYIQPPSFFAEFQRSSMFVEMVRAWAIKYPTPHAMAHSMADDQLSGAPNFGRDEETAQRDGFDKIYEVYWLNVFGPKLVEAVGRERMLSTPAYRVEELPNGSVLLVLRPTAADFASEEARVAQARAHVHLRPELDFDAVLHTLRERSAALAPVEPHFHSDVAPLLSRIPDEFAISERQRKIAELNAYRPPEPEEWLPATLPPDVESQERTRDDYDDLKESLVAALHTSVDSIFEATPESLTDLDFHFWRENFPEKYERKLIDEHTAPAVGAYLGDVLVRRLGGQWIPRKKLEESQVRVGNRVWLPFLRARRYMESRQSLLDYSLTQFFRAAERHRS
ncbi:hypothetical protein JY651_44435 [Pyxidicoccus parkwayensis]|uniref:Uncharacterized protein n=1 Tax=Pyxidicoccus parkwayensis TaxID=2813578 RepID=A0ABX7NXI4_9BACT|nr:hypothetical protein [Pyxidicoccus parkwaysis]QSQ22114.1 hypothetical protein JY651_44435 [Pyxidicoccus parkwaysis]